MPTPDAHAILSPSSSARWLACTPSARLGERLKERLGARSSPEAAEGTIAHRLAELKVRRAVYKADGMTASKLSHLPAEAQAAYTGINPYRFGKLRKEMGDLPQDMERATDDYCNVVMGKFLAARDKDPSAQIMLEQRISMDRWVPECFGSSDCIIIGAGAIEVLDYKHGKGVEVDAHDNPQCRLYGLGALAKYGTLFDLDTITMTIVQPRIDNLSEEGMSTADLLAWGDSIKDRAALAWEGKGRHVPGDHCRFCPAKAICAARVAKSLELFYGGLEAPDVIPDDRIPELLAAVDVAESWIGNFREYVETQALNGQKFRGYKLVRGRRPGAKWADPEEAKAVMLRAGYPLDKIEEVKLKTPAKMKDEIGKADFKALLQGLTTQGEGKLILVPESDKREEYNSALAAFGDMEADITSDIY